MTKPFDLSIYLVADPTLCAGRDIVDVVMGSIHGGVSMVQYRNKAGVMADILAEAAMLREWMPSEIPLLINDHIDVAQAIGAQGVHLGQGDASPDQARALLGAGAIIGQTAFTPAHMAAIDRSVIDYVGCGPFYETRTDKGKPVLGAAGFAQLVAQCPVPVVGIGGITPDNARAVMDAGADGVAMMRSVSEAANVQDAARAFKSVLTTDERR